MNTLRNEFKRFVEIDEKKSKSTANNYACGVQRVCKYEGCTWEELKKNIRKIYSLYKSGGPKEALGKELSGDVICGLRLFKSFVTKSRHKWTFAEDLICCVLYIKTYIIDKKKLHVDKLVENAMPFLPKILSQSIKEKFRNIKEVALERGIADSFSYSEREHASKQNIAAFDHVYMLMTK